MPQMRLLFSLLFVAVLGLGLVAATPATVPPVAPAVSTDELPPPGTVLLTGDLVEPGQITIKELAALPQQTVDVTFRAGQGVEDRTETGPLLADVLPADAIAVDPERRNDILSFAVLAVGSDGYTAAVAYGDVLADFGNRGLLFSLVEDGKALERPRLVVPGDVRGGRYVSDVVELRVVRVGP